MGGVAIPPGNATAFGEFNVVFDPVAANEMAVAPWAVPPRMVGLDVTLTATMGDAEFAVLDARRTPQAAFMADPFVLYRQMSEVESTEGCASHDTLTMMAVAFPELLKYEELPMSVDTAGGAAWGATIVDFRARWIAAGQDPGGLRGAGPPGVLRRQGRVAHRRSAPTSRPCAPSSAASTATCDLVD